MNRKTAGCLSVLIVVFAVLIAAKPLTEHFTVYDKVRLLQALENAHQIHVMVAGEAIEQTKDPSAKGVYPADLGAKSGREYVKSLMDQGVFKWKDMKVFTTVGTPIANEQEGIGTANIGFRFANVSKDDPDDTIVLVSESYLNPQPPRTWLGWLTGKKAHLQGFVVFRKGGDGQFFERMPKDSAILGKLPPREPQFLEP